MIRVPDHPGPIISVDDESMFLELLRFCHGRSAVSNDLITFGSAAECLAYLDEIDNRRALAPALLLLDINMPQMNGFDLLRSIRARTASRTEPAVAMLTSSASPTDADNAIRAGADAVYEKPMRIKELRFIGGDSSSLPQ